MKGKGSIMWGGLVGAAIISGDIDFPDGTKINIVGKVFGAVLGAGAEAPGSGPTEIEFANPGSLVSGHYFTSLAAAHAVYGGGAFTFAEYMFGPEVGHVIFAGMGVGFGLAMGDSVFTVTKKG